eukprot:79280-Pyramimonas_sp.AAC.2
MRMLSRSIASSLAANPKGEAANPGQDPISWRRRRLLSTLPALAQSFSRETYTSPLTGMPEAIRRANIHCPHAMSPVLRMEWRVTVQCRRMA